MRNPTNKCIMCKTNYLPKDRKRYCYICVKPDIVITTTVEDDEQEQEEEGYCPFCNGSGQGMYDGSSCSHC